MQVPSKQSRVPAQDRASCFPPCDSRSAHPRAAPTQTVPPSALQRGALAVASTVGRSEALVAAPAASKVGALERPQPLPHIQILRLPQFSKRVGLQRSAIYARMSPKSKYWDPLFPRPLSLSASAGSNSCHLRRRTAVGWIESEVDAWLAQRSSERAGPSN